MSNTIQIPKLEKATKPTKKYTKSFVVDDGSIITEYDKLSAKLNLRSQQDVLEYMIKCTNYVVQELNKGDA